jgi:hypothetical protein
MYQSIPSVHSNSQILPEQVVLLYFLRKEMEEMNAVTTSTHVLGGEAGIESIQSEHVFLASDYVRMSVNRVNSYDDDDRCLVKSAMLCILDILSESIGCTSMTREDRSAINNDIGLNSDFLPRVATDLGTVLDYHAPQLMTKKVRDMQMTLEDQHYITSLVRVIGNVCYECRYNQDLLRTTSVPGPSNTLADRTALHVLLSCTSLSIACFTLREWAVVALRNVLDNNDDNQRAIEDLQAQQPAPSAELDNLGLRISLDGRGHVSVTPTEKKQE